MPRIDVIPPLGNNLPPSYARRYNRPSYLTGRLHYTIAPATREAMAWHRAAHRGYYANHAPRMVTHYMFPKPWEVVGASAQGGLAKSGSAAGLEADDAPDVPMEALPPGIELAPPIDLLPAPAIN